jgi:Dolichyl-phosphate-mannose-protein mannosyltransferase
MNGVRIESDAIKAKKWIVIVFGVVGVGLAILLLANLDWARAIADRIAQGKNPNLRAYINAGSWWAALVNLCLCVTLITTRRFWTAPIHRASLLSSATPDLSGRVFWVLVLAALVCALGLRVPRMSLTLYNDEAYTLRRHINGEWKGDVFRSVKGNQVLWENRETNNHVLFVLASRLSLRTWQMLTGASRHEFNEAVLRIPALLGGIGSLLAIALLLREIGWARAGVIGAWFGAIQPWHIRYSTEARGYALIFFFVPLVLIFLLRAVRTGRWSDWIGYGVSVFGLLYSYCGAVYLPVCLNVALLLFLWRAPDDYPKWKQFLRLTTVNLVAAMIFLQLMLPGLLQMFDHFKREEEGTKMDALWVREYLSYLLFGIGWRDPQPENPIMISVTRLMTMSGWLPIITLSVVGLAAIAGIVRWIARGGIEAHLAVAMAMAAPLGFIQNACTRSYLYLWYLIFALPVLIVFVGAGIDWIGRLRPRSVTLGAGSAALFMGLYVITVSPQIRAIFGHSREPLRQVAQQLRGEAGANALRAAIHSPAFTYDPQIVQVKSFQQLEGLIAAAREQRRPLNVAYALRGRLFHQSPELVERLNQPDFEHVSTLYGLEERLYTHYVFRLK